MEALTVETFANIFCVWFMQTLAVETCHDVQMYFAMVYGSLLTVDSSHCLQPKIEMVGGSLDVDTSYDSRIYFAMVCASFDCRYLSLFAKIFRVGLWKP